MRLIPRLVPRRLIGAALVAAVMAVPSSALAHDGAYGTPDVTVRIGATGVSSHAVSVPTGGIVAFVNDDDERHRLRSRTRPGEFDTGDLEPGQRYLVRFSSAGTVSYVDERTGAAAYAGTIRVGAAPSGGGGQAGSGAGTSGAGASGSSGAPPAKATIVIADRAFSPGTVTVAAGGTVTWVNRDDREHTASSTGGGPISSPVLGAGSTYRQTFAQAGSFAFLCAIHPEMRGTVKVVATSGGGAPAGATPKPTPSPRPTSTPAPVPQPPAGGGLQAATIVDFEFTPGAITIASGGTVTWTNAGDAPHTVTASDGTFDSGLIDAGATFAQRFDTPGSYVFACSFHPAMGGTVEVLAGAAGAEATAGPSESPASAPTPTTDPSPTAGTAAVVPIPDATASPAPVAAPDASPVAARPDLAGAVGQLGGIALIITVNAWAFLLFTRTVSGAMRRQD